MKITFIVAIVTLFDFYNFTDGVAITFLDR